MAGLLRTSENRSMGTKSVNYGESVFDLNRHKAMHMTQIDIKETSLFNCFIKMSDFANSLGKRMVFEIDWDYITSRDWDITHPYITDQFLELMFGYSLHSAVLGGKSGLTV